MLCSFFIRLCKVTVLDALDMSSQYYCYCSLKDVFLVESMCYGVVYFV